MNNEGTNKGGDIKNSQAQGEGNERHGGSEGTGVQSTHGGNVEGTAAGVGPQGAQPQAEGATANTNASTVEETYAGDLGWMFSGIWNRSLEEREERVYEPRDRMFATELGKAPIDVYLAMKGTKPTNPPNFRSRRKFEAGNMWEWIVGLVLKRAGIIRSAQERVEIQREGMQPVSGRLDYVAGGKIDPSKAREEIAKFELPAAFYKGFDRIVEHLLTKFPEGLADKPLEIKSLSVFMFDAIEKSKKPLRLHVRQLMHYMEAKDFNVGHVVYICREDCRMMEFVVTRSAENLKDYYDAIALRSGYFQRDEMPPLEKPILWENDTLRFSKNNLGMAYSPYLTLLYKFKDQAEFDAQYAPIATSFNRVIKRLAKGDKITPKNEEIFAKMRDMGFDPPALAALIPKDAPEEEEATVVGD